MVQIKKEVVNGKEEEKDDNCKKDSNCKKIKKKTTTCRIKVIDSFRFMSTSLSNLVDNLSGINNKECKSCMKRKGVKSECENAILLSLKIID